MTPDKRAFEALLSELTNAAMAEAYARETAGADAVNQCAARVATARAKAMTAYDTIANALRTAVDRLDDVLKGDDGQAWKEAERVMPNLRRALDTTHPAPKADAAADWVCVPREPTPEMELAFKRCAGLIDRSGNAFQRRYAAMLAASPARAGETG